MSDTPQTRQRIERLEELTKREYLTRAELLETGVSPTTVGLEPVQHEGREVYRVSDIRRLAESGLLIQRR